MPFVTAALAVALARLWLAPKRLAVVAGPAQLVGFLAAYGAILGWPGLPAHDAPGKLADIAVLGTVLGLVQLGLAKRLASLEVAIVLWPIVVVLWLAYPAAIGLERSGALGVLVVAGIAMVTPLIGGRQRDPRRALALLAGALGLALVAAFGRTLSLAELGMALAAALGGTALAVHRAGLANGALLGATSTLLAMATTLVLFTGASRLALLALLPLLAADRLARRLARRRWLERLLFGLACLLPVALALVVARLASGPLPSW